MKKLKRILAACTAAVMSCSMAAFAACDESTGSGSSGNNGNSSADVTESQLYNGILDTVKDVYTSTDGHQITIDVDGSYSSTTTDGNTAYTTACSVDMTETTKIKTVGEALYADAVVDGSYKLSSSEYEAETSYVYTEAYIRGGYLYSGASLKTGTAVTDSEKQELLYSRTDISEAMTTVDAYYDLIQEILSGESIEYAEMTEMIEKYTAILSSIETNYSGVIASKSDGYTLSYDIVAALLANIKESKSVFNIITNYTGTLTVSEFLADETIKGIIDKSFGTMTGADLYEIITLAAAYASYDNETIAMLPEGTANQSAYDYVCALVTAMDIGSTPVNSEEILAQVEAIVDAIENVETSLEDAGLDIVLSFGSDLSFTGVSVTADGFTVSYEGSAISLDGAVSITIAGGGVTLAEESVYAPYATGYYHGYSAVDYINIDVYRMSDGTVKLYNYDEDYNQVYLTSGTYAVDADGNLISITIGTSTYEVSDNYVSITYGGVTYSVSSYFYEY